MRSARLHRTRENAFGRICHSDCLAKLVLYCSLHTVDPMSGKDFPGLLHHRFSTRTVSHLPACFNVVEGKGRYSMSSRTNWASQVPRPSNISRTSSSKGRACIATTV